MTDTCNNKKYEIKKRIIKFCLSLTVIIMFIIALLLSNEISVYFTEGLNLSLKVIIPSVFPFLLLTDLFIATVRLDKITPAKILFERAFKISGNAISAFICGILCGFPIGAKMSIKLYNSGIISKCECERLMSFSNNASPAYVIFVIGLALRKNLQEGIVLYFIMLLSSVLTGIIIGASKLKSTKISVISEQNYSFAESIKQSSSACINICAFITTFAIICGLTKRIVKHRLVCAAVISLLEIGNASLFLSELYKTYPTLSFSLTSFAISFSGISVIAQTVCITDSIKNFSIFNHIKFKLLQGIISAVLSVPAFWILQQLTSHY